MPGHRPVPGDHTRSSALLQALTHQLTFGNKLVAFLRGDATVARSGYCIQLDGYPSGRIWPPLSCCINSLKVIARVPFFFSSLKAGAHFSNSAISRSKMACCFLSSRAMPWLSGGEVHIHQIGSLVFLADAYLGRFRSNCSRLVGVTWPVAPHSEQTFFRNGNRLGTRPLPLHTGHSCNVAFGNWAAPSRLPGQFGPSGAHPPNRCAHLPCGA